MTSFFRVCLTVTLVAIFAAPAFAFTVVHVDYGRSFFFVFDGGTSSGVQEGMTACVDDAMGWELFCGKVERVKTTVAAVEAPDQFEAYFDQGLQVRVMELGAPTGHKRADQNGKLPTGDALEEAPEIGPPQRGAFWTSGLITTPILPYTATFPDFSIDSRFNGKGTVWQPDVGTKTSLFGVRFGRRQPWSRKTDHEINFVWRSVGSVKKQVDYDMNDPEVYAAEEARFTDYSLTWDFLSPGIEPGFFPGWIAGSAAQYVSYAYSSSIVDDTSGTQSGDLASSKARLLALIARLGARIEYLSVGQNAGVKRSSQPVAQRNFGLSLVALMPLFSKTTWSHGAHNAPNDMPDHESSQSELEDVVGLNRSRLGLEVALYCGWMF